MDDDIAEKIEHMRARLDELGVQYIEPRNPYCTVAVLLGTKRQPEIVLNFWIGEPESVEFRRDVLPLKMLPRAVRALERAGQVVDMFPA